MRRGRAGGWIAIALFGCFSAGVAVGWQLRGRPPRPDGETPTAAAAPAKAPDGHAPPPEASVAVPTTGATTSQSPIEDLRQRNLRLPIDGVAAESMRGGFDERRDAGGRPHEAVDLLAPRNTPVHAVEDGTIAKLFFSKAGGNTIYEFGPAQRFCYYYAHLERYADGLHDGVHVSRGDMIGFVGTSGNAPPDAPHLHFAIFELTPARHWWQGTPLDPYLAFR